MVKTVFIKEHCPKCNARLSIQNDRISTYVECIFCGFTRDLKVESPQDKIDWSTVKDVKQHA
jgi:Zn ribbon nucleic-acid-binding protein